MNTKAFKKFLATGEYTPSMDAHDVDTEIMLEFHDRRYHPKGFNPKTDKCSLRETLAKGDQTDASIKKSIQKEQDELIAKKKKKWESRYIFKEGDLVRLKDGNRDAEAYKVGYGLDPNRIYKVRWSHAGGWSEGLDYPFADEIYLEGERDLRLTSSAFVKVNKEEIL